MRVAFDIDDTLLVPSAATGFANDTPNYETVAIYFWFKAQGHAVGLWSGSGIDWAMTWGEKLGLHPDFVIKKEKNPDIDICFDDCDVDLAKVNVKVKRVNNRADRSVWNQTKHEKYEKP